MGSRGRCVSSFALSVAPKIAALGLLVGAPLATAQTPVPGDLSTSITMSALTQLDTDIDQGGRFRWWSVGFGASVTRQFTSALSVGISGRYVFERWSFDTPTAFGQVAPWKDIARPSVGLNLGYNLSKDLSLFIAPQAEWAFEPGATVSDSLNYGAVIGVVKFFSPKLVVGLGAGAFRQIDRNRFFPFVIVNWQITDSLRLTNPLQAGPTGGAGLELAYAWSASWEAAAGAAFREYRFRLLTDGPAPNGLGQNRGVPLFARLTRRFGPGTQVELFAGVVVAGKLTVFNATGATLQSSDYGAAPLIAFSGTVHF